MGMFARDAQAATIYRIGAPLTASEKDSLDGIGHDFREIAWSLSQVQEFVDADSVAAGSLQPKFFQEDEDIAATLLNRDGWVGLVYPLVALK